MFAVRGGKNPQLAKLLIDAGSDVNAKDWDHNTPLIVLFSGSTGMSEASSIIYDWEADAISSNTHLQEQNNNLIAKTSSNVEDTRTVQNHYLTIAKLLIDSGAKIDARNKEGISALSSASRWSIHYPLPEVLAFLIGAGASINAQDNSRLTALYHSTFANNPENTKLLLTRNAAVDLSDTSGITPLMNAAQYSTPETIDILLKAGANINAQSNPPESLTPLMWAIRKRNLDNVKTIVRYHPDMEIKNADGYTALFISKNEILDYLVQYNGEIAGNETAIAELKLNNCIDRLQDRLLFYRSQKTPQKRISKAIIMKTVSVTTLGKFRLRRTL